MKKILLSLLLTLMGASALATPLNIQFTIQQQPNNAFYPGPQYYFYAFPADQTLQSSLEEVADIYYIATPANPSMNIYTTLADAQTAFLTNDIATLITQVNNDYGTSYTTMGTVSPFNQQLQTALASAGTPHVPSTVTRTINGSGTQCTDPTHDCLVFASLNESQSLSLSGGQTGTISFATSTTSSGTYSNFTQVGNSNTGTLVIGLNTLAGNGNVLIGFNPAGNYYKLISGGTGTNSVIQVKELSF